jgi:hypothetical protein
MASSIAQPFLYAMSIIDKKMGMPMYMITQLLITLE